MQNLLRFGRKGKCIDDILEHLKKLPTELKDFYVVMLKELEAELDEDDKKDASWLLQFCLYSHRAIELVELEDAIITVGPQNQNLDLIPTAR
jgi:hypothetical protein